MGGGTRSQELELLVELCRLLGKHGCGVEVRDAIPGLTVTSSPVSSANAEAYVVINGTRFTWWRVDSNHPVSDVEGAAQRIAAFLRREQATDRPDLERGQ
jgi:hypothetical protein